MSGGSGPATRLLVVDDEVALMEALCNTLQQQGYEAVGCGSAKEALALLGTQRFHVMLTDLMMPGIDGIELARAALEVDPQMAIVIMTGQGTVPTAVRAMQSGVLDYVLKPFKLGAVMPVLERALSVHRLRMENAALQEGVAERTLELERVNERLARANHDLWNANRELEAYAATVSHDLRAPLHGIEGLTLLLAQQLETPKPGLNPKELLNLIGARVRRAQRLVVDLLRLSQVSRQQLVRVWVDVDALVKEVIEDLKGEPHASGLAIEVEASLGNAFADPGLLRQIFANLIGNAIKFTQRCSSPVIRVGSRSDDGRVVWFVSDNGQGFDLARATDLFKPFERLGGAEMFEGSGVGLSIARRIAERHGGSIWAESALWQGARFEFSLSGPTPDEAPPG